MKPFTVVSTFAGGGGSSTGYVMAGGKVLLAIEWDDNAVATYKANYPNTPVYHGDIAKLSVDEVLERTGLKPGELDIFDGSPPCQGFSTLGKRDFGDDRNQLFRQYVRLLRGLQPKVFVMENVSGMVKGGMKVIFAEILRELKSSGYKVSVRLMNAMYYGVPQSRQRTVFVGVRNDIGLESSHPTPKTSPVTLRDSISGLGNIQTPNTDHIWVDESATGKNTQNYNRAVKVGQGKSYKPLRIRCEWDKPSPTVTTGGGKLGIPPMLGNSHCHPEYTRTFSLLEYKRVCSFPDDYIFPGKFPANFTNGVFRMGNAVPPLLMKAVATHINENILQRING